MDIGETIFVEVVYVNPAEQGCITVELPVGSTVNTAIEKTNILQRFPDIDLLKNKVGIFSKQVTLETRLQAGDRVEIYRPLLVDPKLARKKRANRVI